jgi:predicted amidophosphoribosyltransferase
MIKEEDCCDNCEEGIEPCCDEELAQHIEEHIVEQDKPEQQTDIITEGVTVDIEELARHLCCQTKFHHIYKVMPGLGKNELINLRDALRSYTLTNSLPFHLNAAFEKAIDNA